MTIEFKSSNGPATQLVQPRSQHVQDSSHPVYQEIIKSVGSFNLLVTVEEDLQSLAVFKKVPGMVAFKTTLRQEGEIVGEGRGTAVLNRENRNINRSIRLAYNCSIVDAVVRSTKILDSLRLEAKAPAATPVATEEEDLEGRDKQVSFGDEDLRYASDKQRNFLRKLVDSNCDANSRSKYISQLNQPQLSSFQCSQLISSLLHK